MVFEQILRTGGQTVLDNISRSIMWASPTLEQFYPDSFERRMRTQNNVTATSKMKNFDRVDQCLDWQWDRSHTTRCPKPKTQIKHSVW